MFRVVFLFHFGSQKMYSLYSRLEIERKENNNLDSSSELVPGRSAIKIVGRAEILPRDFLQTPGNNYLAITIAKLKKFENFTV